MREHRLEQMPKLILFFLQNGCGLDSGIVTKKLSFVSRLETRETAVQVTQNRFARRANTLISSSPKSFCVPPPHHDVYGEFNNLSDRGHKRFGRLFTLLKVPNYVRGSFNEFPTEILVNSCWCEVCSRREMFRANVGNSGQVFQTTRHHLSPCLCGQTGQNSVRSKCVLGPFLEI